MTSIIVLLLGTLILRNLFGWQLALVVSSIKVSITLSYFLFFADGQWFLGGDDYGYFHKGADLFLQESSLIKIWSHPSMTYYLEEQHSIALPIIINYLSVAVFGLHYYAPVFFNLVLTSLSTVFVGGILSSIRLERVYIVAGSLFFALHWVTLTWSSFLNLKEPLVTCLLMAGIFFITTNKISVIGRVLGVSVVFGLMLSVRFYYPVLIVGGILFASVGYLNRNVSIGIVAIVTLVFALVLDDEVRFFFQFANFANFPYEVVHFVLQPAPWKITPPASYLIIPSLLHWITLVGALGGGILLFMSGWPGRVIVSTAVSGIVFYGLIPMIASTRHRVPLESLIVVMQFHFYYVIFMVLDRLRISNLGGEISARNTEARKQKEV